MKAVLARGVSILAVVLAVAAGPSGPAVAKVPPRRYMAAGGLVTDLMTKLVWQQLVSGQRRTWEDAKAYCKALDLKGNGWRLPTVKELMTIVDETPASESVFLPTTDPSYAPDSATGAYWSATKSASYDDQAWQLTAGVASGAYVLNPAYVRCVR